MRCAAGRFDCGLCAGPDTIDLAGVTVDGEATHEACDWITTGSGVEVTAAGNLTLRAGNRIAVGNGFASLAGGRVALEIDLSLR